MLLQLQLIHRQFCNNINFDEIDLIQNFTFALNWSSLTGSQGLDPRDWIYMKVLAAGENSEFLLHIL